MAETHDVTLLLKKVSDGDETAPEKLLPLVYDELRKLANHYMENEREDHTLQAMALVHEAYIRLVDWEKVSWQNRAHFFAVAANVMRRILVDYAREKRAQKRDFGQKLSLDEAISFPNQNTREVDLLALDDALEKLAKFDKTQSKIRFTLRPKIFRSDICRRRRKESSRQWRFPLIPVQGETPRRRLRMR